MLLKVPSFSPLTDTSASIDNFNLFPFSLAAGKVAGVSSDPVYSREILKETVLRQILDVIQDFPLVNPKVTLALLQVLETLGATFEASESIVSAWSPEKVDFHI